MCCEPQDFFFQFVEAVCETDRQNIRQYDRRLGYVTHLRVSPTCVLKSLCLNSAWMSRLHERQGMLLLPPEIVPEPPLPDAALVVAIFHHPYNWLESN